jgi:anti-sigma regulatory factor (Ser/Thr protein kinase)
LPARPSELRAAREYARGAAAAFGLDPDASYKFAFAVNEAVTNAIRHGAPDAQGEIRLSVVMGADRLTLAVHDYGTFLPPTRGGSAMLEEGRGFAMMACWAEVELHLAPTGTIVRLSATRDQ